MYIRSPFSSVEDIIEHSLATVTLGKPFDKSLAEWECCDVRFYDQVRFKCLCNNVVNCIFILFNEYSRTFVNACPVCVEKIIQINGSDIYDNILEMVEFPSIVPDKSLRELLFSLDKVSGEVNEAMKKASDLSDPNEKQEKWMLDCNRRILEMIIDPYSYQAVLTARRQ